MRLKRAIEEELIEYSGLETALEKIAKQFRRSHHHRQQLLHRWETILHQMQDKDGDINRLAQVCRCFVPSIASPSLFVSN